MYVQKSYLPQKMRHGRRMKIPSEADEHIEAGEVPMRKEEDFSGGSSDDGVVVREAETAMMTNMMKAMVTDMIMSKIVLFS